MKVRADLHVHSNLSDGVHSPSELLSIASSLNLGALALTDHDTIDGLVEFMNAEVHGCPIRISGVEISTEYKGVEAHLLGYFIPTQAPKLVKRLKALEESRRKRFPKMRSRLESEGIRLSDDDIDQVLQGVKAPGRPHMAKLLIQRGYVKDIEEAFHKYLGKGKPGYVKKEHADTAEAISLLRAEGAVPVLAHPLTMRLPDLRSTLIELRELGLLGVEIEYDYQHRRLDVKPGEVRAIAEGLGLIETGGSDYHGDGAHRILGSVTVPIQVVNNLRKAHEELRSRPSEAISG
ncbi:MAG: PHP domain-containing protein [Candidatus Thorarchaeota archaeon]|nr:PHP domain-containing protein [Candidatus Thorarchaeota archaeon]